MKIKDIRLFCGESAKGQYWYIPVQNYKDANDKLMVFVTFTKNCPIPLPQKMTSKNGNQYKAVELDELECAFNCYKGKLSISAFEYKIKKQASSIDDSKMFGGEQSKSGEYIDIKSDDLPFY